MSGGSNDGRERKEMAGIARRDPMMVCGRVNRHRVRRKGGSGRSGDNAGGKGSNERTVEETDGATTVVTRSSSVEAMVGGKGTIPEAGGVPADRREGARRCREAPVPEGEM